MSVVIPVGVYNDVTFSWTKRCRRDTVVGFEVWNAEHTEQVVSVAGCSCLRHHDKQIVPVDNQHHVCLSPRIDCVVPCSQLPFVFKCLGMGVDWCRLG